MASATGPGTPDMDHKALQDLQQAAALPLGHVVGLSVPGDAGEGDDGGHHQPGH